MIWWGIWHALAGAGTEATQVTIEAPPKVRVVDDTVALVESVEVVTIRARDADRVVATEEEVRTCPR
jgi:hypothetical protein